MIAVISAPVKMATNILSFVVLSLCLLGASAGNLYDGFRAKYNASSTLVDKEYFFNIPRTVSEAVAGGWILVKRPSGVALPELVMYCRPDDVNVCPLFISGGFVAGIQFAITTEAIQAVPQDPTKKFIKWKDVVIGSSKRDYWATSLYFVSAESLKSGAVPRAANGNTLQDANIWAQDPTASGTLIKIPLKQSDLTKTLYKKENCLPSMGTHYVYNLTPQLPCKDLFPWFLMVKNGNVIGAGITAVGIPQKIGTRQWLENIPGAYSTVAIPTAPACMVEWAVKYGYISLHMYFVDKPWTIKCEAGDNLN